MSFDYKAAHEFAVKEWNDSIQERICEIVRIPSQSPLFDPECLTNGLQEKVLDIALKWIEQQGVKGLTVRVETAEGRTPLLFIDIPSTDGTDKTVIVYSHLDKQPPMLPWAEGLDPYTPVIRASTDHKGNACTKLYGRAGADDSYGVFATISAVKAVQAQGLPHGRVVGLIEFCEESGSFDLPHYLNKLKPELGNPDLLICLDSGCGDFERLWMTTSLRGMAAGVLTVQVSTEGVHSGMGSGIIPSSFRIARQLLDRIEDAKTGEILVPSLYVEIPQDQLDYAKSTVQILGDEIVQAYPFVDGCKPISDNVLELYLNRSWRPTLSYTGIGDIPSLQAAGNVLRPKTSFNLSFRLPPTANATDIATDLKKTLEENPPYGAKVTFECNKFAKGFYCPPFESWLSQTFNESSQALWSKEAAFESCGGSIPFLNILQEMFPSIQFCVAGILGPHTNAHGPNEFLHVEYTQNLMAAVAGIFAAHHKAKAGEQ